MTHTPGPWSNKKWNSQEHQIGALGGTIALVSHDHTLISEESADANAQLIAAAPAMFEALSINLTTLQTVVSHDSQNIAAKCCIARIEKALALAKGEPTS